jgi:hypothetical protein
MAPSLDSIDPIEWVPEELLDPKQAQYADAGIVERTLQGLVAARFLTQSELLHAQRSQQRSLERVLDDFNKTGTMLMSLLRNEREKAR